MKITIIDGIETRKSEKDIKIKDEIIIPPENHDEFKDLFLIHYFERVYYFAKIKDYDDSKVSEEK